MPKLLITISLLFVTCLCFAQEHKTTCCTSKYTSAQRDTLDIHKLAAEYLRLKRAKCEACANFTAPFNDIMYTLGTRLNGKTQREIIKIMGKPDTIKDGASIYFWRGWHDYLYFTFSDGKGTSGWYYAGE